MAIDSAQDPAAITVDLDNLWSYLRSAGKSDWNDYASFFALALPRLLDFLDQNELPATLFIVGRDARDDPNSKLLGGRDSISIQSHSFEHSERFDQFSLDELHQDIEQTEAAIGELSGSKPVGFRSPSFMVSSDLMNCLVERSYQYDSSTFRTVTGPLARWYSARISDRQNSRPKPSATAHGRVGEAFGDLRPHRLAEPHSDLIEIPVTTHPILRMPIHGTYLNFLGDRSTRLAKRYVRSGLNACRKRGVPLVYLLHLTDFIGADDEIAPKFLPGMRRTHQQKTALLQNVISAAISEFEFKKIDEIAAGVS